MTIRARRIAWKALLALVYPFSPATAVAAPEQIRGLVGAKEPRSAMITLRFFGIRASDEVARTAIRTLWHFLTPGDAPIPNTEPRFSPPAHHRRFPSRCWLSGSLVIGCTRPKLQILFSSQYISDTYILPTYIYTFR